MMEPIEKSTIHVRTAPRGDEELRRIREAQQQTAVIDKNPSKQSQYHDVADTPSNREKIQSAIKALEIFQPHHPQTRFQYSVHENTGKIQVTLVNYITGEVVDAVPSSKLLDFAARMEELSGLILEKKA